ncbi:MAG: hypothetical protein SXV54_13905 [Chloroflexota bacterium]|nr:hypothetical protein [Chloroflexota bacterium]
MSEEWLIEYHPGKKQFHFDILQARLRKNHLEILDTGDVLGKGWVPLAVARSVEELDRVLVELTRQLGGR